MTGRSPWRAMSPDDWDAAAENLRATRNDALQRPTPAVEAPTAVDGPGIELAAADGSRRPQTALDGLAQPKRRNGDFPRFPDECRRHRWLEVIDLQTGDVLEPRTYQCWFCGAARDSGGPR